VTGEWFFGTRGGNSSFRSRTASWCVLSRLQPIENRNIALAMRPKIDDTVEKFNNRSTAERDACGGTSHACVHRSIRTTYNDLIEHNNLVHNYQIQSWILCCAWFKAVNFILRPMIMWNFQTAFIKNLYWTWLIKSVNRSDIKSHGGIPISSSTTRWIA